MKVVTVFGANGRVGRLVVEGLLDRGYQVIAFVHGTNDLRSSTQLHIVKGDITNTRAVNEALTGSHAVISTLGSWGTKEKNTLSEGMRQIIPLMKKHRVKRIISLTGSEARASQDVSSFVHRLAHAGASIGVRKILKDAERHISLLETSSLDWTVIRSPIMNENDSPEYELNFQRPQPWHTINRHGVADALLHQLTDREFIGKAPFINRSGI